MGAKPKVSKVKRNNFKRNKVLTKPQVTKKNVQNQNPLKLKTKKNKKDSKKNGLSKITPLVPEKVVEDSNDEEDMLEMMEDDDLKFLKDSITNSSYSMFKNVRKPSLPRSQKRKNDETEENLENEYEKNIEEAPTHKIRRLLPIKTKEGLVSQQVVVKNDQIDNENEEIENEDEEDEEIDESENDETYEINKSNTELDISKPLLAANLFAQRNKLLNQRKLDIGVLSSQILENPQERITNLRSLLLILDEQIPEIYVTVRKLVIVSLVEIFKDIIPSYKIRNHKDEGVLLKKTTLQLRKFETELLQFYKKFLQKLEKASMVLLKKKGNTNIVSTEGQILGELSIKALCDLISCNPYFNFSENIAQTIVPFLNHKDLTIRNIVKNSITTIFKEDKKEELTLKILRIVNHYLKVHAHNVKIEMLEILLVLNLKDINLEKEKELDIKQKKLESKKQNVLSLSRKERKRKKQLKHLENELLETKAEENKQTKQRNLTEITKTVFAIYFRILKSSTNNKAVAVCLEGLAKYAHCINLDYYVDIVNLLDKLLKEEWLGYKEQLHCIQTVFAILSGQGEALNIDPIRFYNNLYKNLLQVNASSKSNDFQLITLQVLVDSLIKRRKKITKNRLLGFIKRLSIISLQLLHHGSLGNLGVIRNLMQLNKSMDIILDTDNTVGDGNYNPELDDPEYSNASSTALYEMILLNKHYHPIVSKFAKNIANGVPSDKDGSLLPEIGKLNPIEIFEKYDMTQMVFNPPVPVKKKTSQNNKIKIKHSKYLTDNEFDNYCKNIFKNQKGTFLNIN